MELIAVDGVLPDTSVKLGTKDEDVSRNLHLYNDRKMAWARLKRGGFKAVNCECACVYLLSLPLGIAE